MPFHSAFSGGLNLLELPALISGVISNIQAAFESEQFNRRTERRQGEIRGNIESQRDLGLTGSRGIPVEGPTTQNFDIAGQQGSITSQPAGTVVDGQFIPAAVEPGTSFEGLLGLRDFGLEELNRLDQDFRARQAEGLRRSQNLRGQQRLNLRTDFDSARGRELSALQNRGGGGFLASSVRLQNDRARQEGLAFFDEQSNREQLGIFERFSADTINNQSAGIDRRLQLEAAPVNFNLAVNDQLNRFDASTLELPPGQNLPGALADTLLGVNTAFVNSVGGGKANAGGGFGVSDALGFAAPIASIFNPVVGAGLSVGSAATTTSGGGQPPGSTPPFIPPPQGTNNQGQGFKSFQGCVDGDAMIEMADGSLKALKAVQIGDLVLNAEGSPEKVIDKDYGLPHEERRGDYIVLRSDYNMLVITNDHLMGGKPAGELPHDPHPSVVSGDLELESGGGYIANGFPVDSMMSLNQVSVVGA